MPHRFIFLDIDGVLVTIHSLSIASSTHAPADLRCLEQLNRITHVTGAHIVISSTWRLHSESRDAIRRMGIDGRIVSVTPNLTGHTSGDTRGQEIQLWMDEWGERHIDETIDSYVILDDDPDMGELLPALVHCSMQNGLTEELADRAIKILLGGVGQ